ncbi:DUF3515 domain-containing protein [Nocardia concava]|uniref:DUF3515 domain-containing protein n=1 Tax=Nocardia concava TaxID=257281 RepID=UPI0002F94640|nr:DUF3515 domain-containing protein [Nocardia concava]
MSNDTRDTEPDAKDAAPDTKDAAPDTEATTTDAKSRAATGAKATDTESAADDTESVSDGEDLDAYEIRRSPALIATAVALPVALVVGLLVMGVLANRHHSRDPLALGAVPAPTASGPECSALMPALPSKIGDYTTADLVAPAPPATHAWQLPDGGDAIVVRCGLDRPLEFTQTSPLLKTKVAGGGEVEWFEVRDQTTGVTQGTWWAVDRGTYIALTVPDNVGSGPLQDVSEAIAKTIPAKPIDPNPIPN